VGAARTNIGAIASAPASQGQRNKRLMMVIN
jgi:hypothetical protein